MAPREQGVRGGRWDSWWPYVLLLAALLAAYLGLGGVLAFAGVSIFPFGVWVVKPLEEAARGHVVTAAVSWVAGVGALATFIYNYKQKESLLARQLAEQRQIEDARRAQEREFETAEREQARVFEDARERRERDLAELQRIEAEFAALADDFAQDGALARVNAAIGMGELARRPDPRRTGTDGEMLPDPRPPIRYWVREGHKLDERTRDWPDQHRSRKTERNHPYFLRAAHRLAAALVLWEDASARAQAVRVLKEMGDWAKDEGADEPLLHALVNALAEANRNAWGLLRERAALCVAAGFEEEELAGLLGIGPEPEGDDDEAQRDRQARRALLADLQKKLREHPAFLAYVALPEGQREATSALRARFRVAAEGLWATRDALATALRQLSAPPGAHEEVAGAFWMRWREHVAPVLKARRALDLRGVRLFRADCQGARLAGADCVSASFAGTTCFGASFAGADCQGTSFAGADCRHASFAGADCQGTSFAGADCAWASFAGADCAWARRSRGRAATRRRSRGRTAAGRRSRMRSAWERRSIGRTAIARRSRERSAKQRRSRGPGCGARTWGRMAARR